MGRACMDLWTDVHYVLKIVVLVLIAIVEYLVLDGPIDHWHHACFVYLEGYYLSSLIYLGILLYGYTWFALTPKLEISTVFVTILMLAFSVIVFSYEYFHGDRVYHTFLYRFDRNKYMLFVILTLVEIVILVIDLILLVCKGGGKGVGGTRGARHEETA